MNAGIRSYPAVIPVGMVAVTWITELLGGAAQVSAFTSSRGSADPAGTAIRSFPIAPLAIVGACPGSGLATLH
jgi:hypothetical protein